MNHLSIIERMENNMRGKLAYIPNLLEGMSVQAIGDITVVDCGMPSDTFNAAYGGTITPERAKQVFEYYRGKPMAWWLGPSTDLEAARASLESAGFKHDEYDVGMRCDLTTFDKPYVYPEWLRIELCETPQQFEDFGAVLASVFDPEDAYVKQFYRRISELDLPEMHDLILFVGYDGEKPVSTSALFLTDCAGIFDISTRPEERKRGLGTAMFYRAVIEAKQLGYELSVLQASPDGLGIYERMGFERVCDFNVWSNSA